MRILVTGGAGFIGSHLADRLMERGDDVRVLDNLSAGSLSNLGRWQGDPRLDFVRGDLLKPAEAGRAVEGCDAVYHLAANPEVRVWRASPEDHFKQNIEATYNLLEAMRMRGDAEALVFTSSSTVYGEADILPTPEDYAPLKPISLYGASKLAAEALTSAYASMYGFRCVIYRMANVVGPRCTQSKSYLHVDDCIEGMMLGAERAEERVEVLNIGSEDRIDVRSIARIVIEEMGLSGVEIRLTGGVDGGRGWKGDVKLMQLDMSRLRSLGWRPRLSSAEAVRETARALVRSG